MKKLLLAAVSFAVFTLHGLDQVQLVAVIAFSAGVYAPRFLTGEKREHLFSPSARFARRSQTPQ
jgi:hypothetical protein